MNGVQMPLQKLNSETGTGKAPTYGYEGLKTILIHIERIYTTPQKHQLKSRRQ